MSIYVVGSSGVTAEVDGTLFRALRVAIRPADYGNLGSYIASTSMILATTINAPLSCLGWFDATRLCIFRKAKISLAVSASAVSSNAYAYEMVIDRNGLSGSGTSVSGISDAFKLKSVMGTSQINEQLPILTGGLTPAGSTPDSQGVGNIVVSFATGATTVAISSNVIPLMELYDCDGVNGQPIVLANRECITLFNKLTTTRNRLLGLTYHWAEVASY